MPRTLGDKTFAGKDDDKRAKAEKQQKQDDREQQTRPTGSLGRPIQKRRADIGDDAGEHEGQQNQFDQIKKNRKDDRADHDRAGLSQVERAGDAKAFAEPRLVALTPVAFHREIRPFQPIRPLSLRRTLSSASNAPTV